MACEKCGSDSCNCGLIEVQIIAPPEEAPAPDNESYIFHGIGHQTQEETVYMTTEEHAEYVKLKEDEK